MPTPSDAARATGFADTVALRAGPLRAEFEPASGFLRRIRLGESEVLRGLYAAVRTANWDTVPTEIRDLRIVTTEAGFEVSFRALCRSAEADFVWRGTITGTAEGTIRYSFDGEAQAAFDRNRIGFCVLHPMALAGRPCRVERDDGSLSEGAFPGAISPHQPFMEMRAITHEVAPGLTAETRFEGDIFEMEDQRNWTDASFKTYCTPLALPFPVRLAPGDRVSQSVTLSLHGEVPGGKAAAPGPILDLDIGDRATPLPRLGLGRAHHGAALTPRERTRLRALAPAHLRVDLTPARDDAGAVLGRAASEAGALGAGLELALFLGDDPEAELDRLAALLPELAAPVARWLILGHGAKVTPPGLVATARRHLAPVTPEAAFGAGTDAFFTELNRERPELDGVDFLGYSLNPQVHAFDSASLVETLEAQPATVTDARAIGEGRPVAVAPITLRPRYNPNATGPAPETPAGALPPQVDPRQAGLLAAGWTVASVAALAAAGADSLTLFETTGWRGVMETAAGAPLPDEFASVPGGVFPVYHALADIADFAGGEVLEVTSADPLSVRCLALRRGGRVRLLVANLSPAPVHLALTCPALPGQARVRVLDGRNAAAAMADPESWRAAPGRAMEVRDGGGDLPLAPCALARIDGVEA